jgi:hypothetical protein
MYVRMLELHEERRDMNKSFHVLELCRERGARSLNKIYEERREYVSKLKGQDRLPWCSAWERERPCALEPLGDEEKAKKQVRKAMSGLANKLRRYAGSAHSWLMWERVEEEGYDKLPLSWENIEIIG